MKRTKEKLKSSPSDPLDQFISMLDESSKNHRSLILVASGILELGVETLFKKNYRKHPSLSELPNYKHGAKLDILYQLEVIDDQEYKVLDGVRRIRNEAAHEVVFELSFETLEKLGRFNPTRKIYENPNQDKVVEWIKQVVFQFWAKFMYELFNDLLKPETIEDAKNAPLFNGKRFKRIKD